MKKPTSSKPRTTRRKSPPVQVRLDPVVLNNVRALAGHGGVSEWIRLAVDDKLSSMQPAVTVDEIEPAVYPECVVPILALMGRLTAVQDHQMREMRGSGMLVMEKIESLVLMTDYLVDLLVLIAPQLGVDCLPERN